MSLKRICREIKAELFQKPNNKKLLLEKENLECLESILESETKKLCSKKDIQALRDKKKVYSGEELYAQLYDARLFVNNFTGLSANMPKVDYFSLLENNQYSNFILGSYIASGIITAISIPVYQMDLSAGFCLSLTGISTFAILSSVHMVLKTTSYLPMAKKITTEPRNELILPTDLAHEYTHHLLRQNKIFMPDIEEGFARNVERHYGLHLAEKNNDERFVQDTLWNHCLELNEAYSWTCNKLGKKAAAFKNLEPAKGKKPDSYTLGSALLRIAEERDGINAYKNLLHANIFSRTLFYV